MVIESRIPNSKSDEYGTGFGATTPYIREKARSLAIDKEMFAALEPKNLGRNQSIPPRLHARSMVFATA